MYVAAVYDLKYGPEPRDSSHIVKSEEDLVAAHEPVSVNTSAEMAEMGRQHSVPRYVQPKPASA